MLIFSVALRLAGVACIALLFGCTGTSDIIAEDSSTLVGSAGFERKLSDRGALEGRYLVTGGTSQDGGSIIQIDGERFDATGARNSFQLHVLSMHYRFHLINSDRFRLTIAPGAEASHVELATKLPTRQINSSETSVGLGMKLGMAFSFSDSLSLEHEFSVTTVMVVLSLTRLRLETAATQGYVLALPACSLATSIGSNCQRCAYQYLC
jgi:hypothetical protein